MKVKPRPSARRAQRKRSRDDRARGSVRIYERWDTKRIVDKIREIHRGGGRLAHSQAPPRLVHAALVHLGSWRRAIERAGLDYEAIRLPTNPGKLGAELVAMLRERAKSGRIGVGSGGLITATQADRVRRRFGTVRTAIQLAGLDADALGFPARTRYNTDEAIVRKLRSLMRERPSMRLADLSARSVGEAVKRRHGNLRAGLHALGIEGWPRQRNFPLPSREEVLIAIQARRRGGNPMDVTSVMMNERRLVKAAYKWFGTWRAAMRAAGFAAQVKHVDWNRARVRAELNGRLRGGAQVDERSIRRDDPELWRGIIERYANLGDGLRDARRAKRRSALRKAARPQGNGTLR